ncbi:MAG: NAD(P)-dependent alcohol dehydrogenase [Terrimicrobiaceae bacterium]|nr:NAD(P)-dependent alcohol dehydrogenase [Terrimicrobiaceae bacterium]
MSDGIGSVLAVGGKVTRVKPGDRVAGIFDQNWLAGEIPESSLTLGGSMDGVLAQQIVLHQDGVTPVPEHLTDEEAAALPCAAVTAWNALMVQGELKPGATVLVQGTGGVSLFALQFALLGGARVIVLSSSDEKLERARQLGAHELINYKQTPDWDKEARSRTGGQGVDRVIEVGGPETLHRSLNAVRTEGQISLVGILSGASTEIFIPSILTRQICLKGVYVGSRRTFEQMNAAISLHKLRPVVDRVFPFEEAVEALRYMKKGGYFGKIAVRF